MPSQPNDKLDLRGMHIKMPSVEGVLLEREAWNTLVAKCDDLNDDEFHITKTEKMSIEFQLLDRRGVPQDYIIHAIDLPRTNKITGTRMVNVYLTFKLNDGTPTVDSGKEWFGMFQLWLNYWAGTLLKHPRKMMFEAKLNKQLDESDAVARTKRWQNQAKRN